MIRELRDKQSIARVAALGHDALFAVGVVSAFATTGAADEQRARAALIAALEKLSKEPLDEARCQRRGRSQKLLEPHSCSPKQNTRSSTLKRSFINCRLRGVDSFDEQVSKLTADDIKRIAASYFKTSAACAGVVRGSPPAAPAPAKQQ